MIIINPLFLQQITIVVVIFYYQWCSNAEDLLGFCSGGRSDTVRSNQSKKKDTKWGKHVNRDAAIATNN